MIDSRCGLNCKTCTYREPNHCGGCAATNGHPFHGECPVAVCCQNKGYIHCGQCPDLPCELLTDYSCEPEYGDAPHGARIAQCIRWREEARCAGEGFTFGGINIYAKEPVTVLNFYRALGLRVVREPAAESRWYGAELALQGGDSPVIWIWRLEEGDGAKNHLVFHADCGLDVMYERICKAGIACNPPFMAGWGGQELILQDPAGNEILFL